MEFTADFVSHRVVHAKERICKGHSGKTRCIVHFFFCFRVGGSVFVRAFKVLEYHFNCLNTKTVCKIVGKSWNISFCCVGKNIHSRIGNNFCRKIHGKWRINNGNCWSKGIICKRIFFVFFSVGNYGKRCNFRTCSRCCRNTDKPGFFAKRRIAESSFADIHKFLLKIVKINFWIFVEQPHAFCSIHSRTAAQRNYCVRGKIPH